MSDHLPECPLASDCKHDYYDEPPIQCADCGEECICDRLRACEKRVREDERTSDYTGISAAMHTERMRENYERGLDAAREAVAAVSVGGQHFWAVGFRDGTEQALAAIDALKENK